MLPIFKRLLLLACIMMLKREIRTRANKMNITARVPNLHKHAEREQYKLESAKFERIFREYLREQSKKKKKEKEKKKEREKFGIFRGFQTKTKGNLENLY